VLKKGTAKKTATTKDSGYENSTKSNKNRTIAKKIRRGSMNIDRKPHRMAKINGIFKPLFAS
jgi:hypothetical protein